MAIKAYLTAIVSSIFAILSVVIFTYRFDFLSRVEDWSTWFTPGRNAFIIAIILLVPTLYLTIKAWRNFGNSKRSSSQGAAALIGLLATFSQTVIAAHFYQNIEDITLSVNGIRDIGNANVTLERAGVVYANGPIGEHFATDIMALNDETSPIKELRIYSNGGLIDPAFEVAQLVKAQNITVSINSQCASACTLIAFSSPNLRAIRDSEFGFHREGPVVPEESGGFNPVATNETDRTRTYLALQGVPEKILIESDKFHGDETYNVTAKQLFDDGLVKELLAIGALDGG